MNGELFMKYFKFLIIVTILLCTYIFACAYSYVNAISKDLKNSVFRLHVIANSNSVEDQALKYIVRDNLLEYMNKLCINCSNKDQALLFAESHKEDFRNIAKKTIQEAGYDYDVDIEIGEFNFPTKNYGDISLPAGIYDALRVKIGKASGQNWWCVMFPPLCFVDISSGTVPDASKELLEDELNSEEFSLISESENSNINFKFKLLELFSNSGLHTAKN